MLNNHFVEPALFSDIAPVQALDALLVGNDSRAEYLHTCIGRGECFVVRSTGCLAGFAIFEHKFFGNAFISLVMVHPQLRRQGLAMALINYCLQASLTEKLFSSTNRSNKTMQQVFDKAGFVKSGCVDNLDDNDPEWFYYRRKNDIESVKNREIAKPFRSADPEINWLREADIPEIVAAFRRIGWNKPAELYKEYLVEQQHHQRAVWVARVNGAFAGYLTLCRCSHYPPFEAAGIPEIKDLNVLPEYRNNGIASLLLDEAEATAHKYSGIIGIGVGMYPDYGAAQRLYVKRGYIPDGRGLCYDYQQLSVGESTINDDNLVLMLTKKLD